MRADLHSHSTASDGLNAPADNVKLAKEAGLAALGVTDHDSVSGIDEAIKMAEKIGIEVVPGIEMSTVEKGQDIHVLGYFIRYKDKEFLNTLDELQKARDKRNEMIIVKLNELGIQITLDEVKKKIRREGANVGRPHIAEVLIEKKVVDTMEEAFDLYLGKKGKAYVNPIRISPEEGIDIIKKAGGVPVLAHPGLYDDDEMVVRLIKYGLKGIEAFHPDHDEEAEKRYQEMGETYGIIVTAGSDFHGSRNGEMFHAPIGTKMVPYQVVERLKNLRR
ncbi:PHP domain-containing protein [Tepidibacillus decaturensis]|uniref:Metal-dependent phosphoesterase n=1 Tax=Tepidibacillus decaturensis TaxID=1413211 RepID=A0A135L485_9BACI|nr:PHP domain-containing protein [Tepidibacillus decaturensis]KXG43825.1 metal-dependent phosphoesterase [Tepidibacillus decaturensis]